MARLATLLVEKARSEREKRGAGIHDKTVLRNGVTVRRNKYDTGFVFTHGDTSIYIDDDPSGVEVNDEMIIIAKEFLTTRDIINDITSTIDYDIDNAIKFLL